MRFFFMSTPEKSTKNQTDKMIERLSLHLYFLSAEVAAVAVVAAVAAVAVVAAVATVAAVAAVVKAPSFLKIYCRIF